MNLYPLLSKKYPEGSVQGQCFSFLHKLINFPDVGNLLSTKKVSLAKFGIPIQDLATIKVGDVLLLNYPVWGHGALVNCLINGQLQLSEANFNLDLKVHHTRQISHQDPNILGVFRGNYLFALPPINYPIVKNVLIFQNNQPVWGSMIKHLSNLQQWFWTASGQRLQINAFFTHTNLTGWDKVVTGDGMGGFQTEVIKVDWLQENVLPLIPQVIPNGLKVDFVVFNMPKSEWANSVVGHPELMEAGFAYQWRPDVLNSDTTTTTPYPGIIMTALDEFDDYPIYYPAPLSAFAKYVAHELSHLFYMLCLSDKFGEHTDLTHTHFYGLNGNPVKPEAIFDDFDFSKL